MKKGLLEAFVVVPLLLPRPRSLDGLGLDFFKDDFEEDDLEEEDGERGGLDCLSGLELFTTLA